MIKPSLRSHTVRGINHALSGGKGSALVIADVQRCQKDCEKNNAVFASIVGE